MASIVRLINFASGSKGNSTLVTLGETHLLIDCGISFRRLQLGLNFAGVALDDIEAVIITHTHSDHIGGLPVWFRKSHLKFLVPELAARSIVRMAGAGNGDGRFAYFRAGRDYRLADVELNAFPVSHDAPETVGLKLVGEGERLAYVTDLGVVAEDIPRLLERQDVIFLEANHEPELVAACSYPALTKKRILGPRGHLSNQQALALLTGLAFPPRAVVFGHLSENNNSPELLQSRAVECELERRVEHVAVASQRRVTSVEL